MNSYIKKYWIVLLLLLGVGSFGGWYYFFYDPNYCYKNQTYLTDEQYIDIAVHQLDDAMNQVFVGHSSYEKIKLYLKKHPEKIIFHRDMTKPKQFEWVAAVHVTYDFDEEEKRQLKEKRDENSTALHVDFTFDACGDYLDTGEQTTPYEWIKNTQTINKEY
ncbi:hypothetical protein [Sulfuricurvum sp.]|uniref:hypothetical protein n=1 Tax=Sulfuricurvum sp. TaxID=2025608 RepID=UPI002D23DDFE|nr:hypothetical protein [Sulfuricurvum sp.]HZF71412.1 hypothetical protein [Sulfuricurvum sp.]